jgi:hypothetical protein
MAAVEMLVDDRGDLLRAAVRGDDGRVDLSLWRDDRCRATFRLDPGDAARLAHLLVTALETRATPAA